MTWDTFFERFYDWSDAGQKKLALMQKEFGDEDEVSEIAMAFFDEKTASKFVGRALAAGVRFSADSLTELAEYIDEDTLFCALRETDEVFTAEQIADLDCYVSEDILESLKTEDSIIAPAATKRAKKRRRETSGPDSITGSPLLDVVIGIKFFDWLFPGSDKRK